MDLIKEYAEKKGVIGKRLKEFKQLDEGKWRDELLFCILTPQSNAQSCWKAVVELKEKGVDRMNEKQIASVLRSKTRFHNNKAGYVLEGINMWSEVKSKIELSNNVVDLRNWIAENVKGMGYKEAGHFLRNIGKSESKIAILDRHILRNLKSLRVIDSDELKGKRGYFEVERKFIDFSEKAGIKVDELDLLFWSRENGEIFK